MDFMTTKDAALKWGLTDRMFQYYCKEAKIKGAIKAGSMWLLPKDTCKPLDMRTKEGRNANVQ